jgi:hypothetical protein
MVKAVAVQESDGSRRAVLYEVANGERIPNAGEQQLVGWTTDNQGREIKAQVCDVNMGLLAVKRMVEAGNRVEFEPGGAYTENAKTKHKSRLEEEGGMYALRMRVNKRQPV